MRDLAGAAKTASENPLGSRASRPNLIGYRLDDRQHVLGSMMELAGNEPKSLLPLRLLWQRTAFAHAGVTFEDRVNVEHDGTPQVRGRGVMDSGTPTLHGPILSEGADRRRTSILPDRLHLRRASHPECWCRLRLLRRRHGAVRGAFALCRQRSFERPRLSYLQSLESGPQEAFNR